MDCAPQFQENTKMKMFQLAIDAVNQDTLSCVVQPSSGTRDTVCYLHELTVVLSRL